jgi:Flp pilus assembly protein TadD
LKQLDPVAAKQPAPPSVATVEKRECDKESNLPPRTPKASTCVALADWYAREAQAPERPQAQVDYLRDVARKQYQQALSIDPNHLPAYQALGRLYVAMGDQAHAVATLRKGIEMGPKNAPLWYDLGTCYLRQRDWEPALQCLNRAVDFDPENREYVNMLGHTLSRTGHYPESVAIFSRIYGEAKAYYNVARMLQHLNNPELSKQYLRVAVQKDPTLEVAQQLLTQLEGGADANVKPVGHTMPDKLSAPDVVPAVFDNKAPAARMDRPSPASTARTPSGPILPPDPIVPKASITPPDLIVPPPPPPISFRRDDSK